MKRIFCIIVLLSGFLSPAFTQGWQPVESGTTEWMLSLSFPTAETGYASGWSGTILKTTDGGTTWIKQESGTVNTLHSISFSTVATGYAVGEYGTILKTTDGGSHWIDISPGIAEALLSVHFPVSGTGFAAGAAFASTLDGGSTWSSSYPPDSEWFTSIFFLNKDTGMAVSNSGKIFRTLNGGISWAEQNHEALRLTSIFFVNDTIGYAAGENALEQGMILRTADGGENWVSRSFAFTKSLSDIQFPVKDTGYAVGGNGNILKTCDGGLTWTDQSYNTPQWLNAVCFTDAGHGIIAATGGLILKTTNGGVMGSGSELPLSTVVRISPNPAGEFLDIENGLFSDRQYGYTVLDMSGMIVQRGICGSDQGKIRISALPKGVYLLRLTGGKSAYYGKFVKL